MTSADALGADYTVHVVEPAVTNHMILPDGPLPAVCKQKSEIKLSGCRGEYEPASFVVTTSKSLEGVRIEGKPLRGDSGQWTDKAMDVRVVKEYYGRSTAGLTAAVPMLLVHDDSFLGIEPAPTKQDPKAKKNVARGELRDTLRLQPVNIDKRRQFWITVHIPDHAEAGTYRTTLRIVPANSEPAELELEVEVYPFELHAPMLEYSIYYPVVLVPEGSENWRSGKRSGGGPHITPSQYIAECKNMIAHGMTNPNIYGGVSKRPDGTLDYSGIEKILAVREEAGMGPGLPLYTMSAAAEPVPRALTEDEKRERIRIVRKVMAWGKRRGYPDIYWAAQDEAWGDWLASERDSFQAIHDGGGKVFVACSGDFFGIVGDVLHRPVMHVDIDTLLDTFVKQRSFGPDEWLRRNDELAGTIGFERQVNNPTYRRAIDGLHRLGRKIFTYTTLRPPLPQWQRRYEGPGLWRVGFDGVMNWAYTHISGDGVNQGMHFAMVFRTDVGVLDTLYWEGFREGVDDVRYLTTLMDALARVRGRFSDNPLIRQTDAWLAEIDVAKGDLDAIRHEMAQRIIALQDLGHKDLTSDEALKGIDVEHIEIVTLDKPWRFRLVELDYATMIGPKADDADEGLRRKWFKPTLDDSKWSSVQVGTGYTRGAGGGWGNESGFGWYRSKLPLTDARRAKRFQYLHFGACDEDAWVYLNGRKILEHTVEKTGMLASEIWRTPFVVPLSDVKLRGRDLLAVRIRNTSGMGGIWKPVRLILGDQELTQQQVKALIELKTAKDRKGS